MITLNFTDIFIVYISITLFGILVIYLYSVTRKYSARKYIEDRLIVTCPVCAYRYIADGREKIHRCPQCESLNELDTLNKS